MKLWIIAGVWFFGYLLTVFLLMLILRLEGDDPEDVYEIDADTAGIYLFLILLWPIALVIEILYFLYKFLRKWFVLAIEVIVAAKELKQKEYEDDNNDKDN